MSLLIERGDLLEAPELYIGHQCNCITCGNGAGLAKLLFKKYPYANVYAGRTAPSLPGTYSLHGNGREDRFVVNFYAQYNPGKARAKNDGKTDRLNWLLSGVKKFASDCKPEGIALPYGIGCGLAGGDWQDYQSALELFAQERGLFIKLYKL